MAAIGFFKSPTTGNAVTWDETGAQTDTGLTYDGYQLPVAQQQTSFGGGAEAPTAAPVVAYNSLQDNNYFISPSTGNMVTWDANGTQTDTGLTYDGYQLPVAQQQTSFGGGAEAPTAAPVVAYNSLQDNNYFISPSTGNMVTWDANGTQTDTGHAPGLAQNLAAAAEPVVSTNTVTQNDGSNRGTGSVYNHWTDMPTDTYQQYETKMASASNDPLSAWLNAGATTLTQPQFEQQQQVAASSPNSWGGGDTPASQAAHDARVAAIAVPAVTPILAPPIDYISSLSGWGPARPQGPLTQAGLYQPGQTAGTGGIANSQFTGWSQPQAGAFNTPVLDALYRGQQQRMTTPAPQFNFQDKPGALTQAIKG